jgi:hypothetical protein
VTSPCSSGCRSTWSVTYRPFTISPLADRIHQGGQLHGDRGKTTGHRCDVPADLEAISQTNGVVRDPELYRRVTERADRVRRETLEKFGVQEIGAEIIRTMHDE